MKGVLWYSTGSNFTISAHELNPKYVSVDYTLNIITKFPRGNELNSRVFILA